MNIKDLTFTYNLISLHYDIMWYIIIILLVVYWCLYKILKEYIWTNFNKQDVNYFSGCHIFYLLKYYLIKLLFIIVWLLFVCSGWIINIFKLYA